MQEIGTFRISLPSQILRRGFWLYVWRVVRDQSPDLLYVGRTGDNSSPNASPPYIRMGQHLGSIKNQNALRQHLCKRGITPEDCQSFELVAHGPIYPEVVKPENFSHSDSVTKARLMKMHRPIRDIVGAMEKRLAGELRSAGYDVLNSVKWQYDVPEIDWLPVRQAFAADFPKLGGTI
ncbi:conserved hypothetical protein [Rhodopseudomonas palustris TIE-1]|uniref:hypothetical protein n=1 Tax=Rhodopseudomonas palustris TaxID=1076 RepID=UPI000177965F|nr:hypothetical protein [Rhodopseudomonas palustris]ACF00041.1 conserved hypothetical protein [Rhodopseudomonas palustris TIE-1]